ncbi:uncharacterized protein [Leptinotarsa decemlineata]|uniref:uncharacterized protein n=1 Tax=Leptinotarsa decemlineata TaxID=7539 RepID=UPI003D30B735
MKASRPHVSKIQKQYLLQYLQKKPKLAIGKFSPTFTIEEAQIEWQALATALNRLPGKRSIKSWKQWRKTWHDMKSKVKMKSIKDYRSLTSREMKVLRISDGSEENDQSLMEEDSDEYVEDSDEYVEVNNNDHKQGIMQDEDTIESILINITPDEEQDNANGNQKVQGDRFSDYKVEDDVDDTHGNTTEVLHDSDEHIMKITASYYERKLACLNRIADAKERSSWAKVRIANALEEIARNRTDI